MRAARGPELFCGSLAAPGRVEEKHGVLSFLESA